MRVPVVKVADCKEVIAEKMAIVTSSEKKILQCPLNVKTAVMKCKIISEISVHTFNAKLE